MIKFNLTSELIISNGAKIEEIGNALQNFTQSYLYLDEDLNLNSINEFNEMPYGKCVLDVVEQGFLLTEEKTGRLVHVFHKELMNYLVNLNSEKIEFTDFQGYTEEISTFESDETDESSEPETPLDFEAIFRIQLRDSDDYDNDDPVYIDEEIFSQLEIINDIDLRETLDISFSSFLSNKGYIAKTNIYFYENKYAEIVIYTNKPIDREIINRIETDAILEVNSNDLIYFNYTKRENVYSESVTIDRLPSDLIELCMKNKKHIPEVDNTYTFYYKNSEFKIKNEGYGFFSVFDLDLHFYLSRLHPDYYPNVYEYNELPIAQFYYKK